MPGSFSVFQGKKGNAGGPWGTAGRWVGSGILTCSSWGLDKFNRPHGGHSGSGRGGRRKKGSGWRDEGWSPEEDALTREMGRAARTT